MVIMVMMVVVAAIVLLVMMRVHGVDDAYGDTGDDG